MPDEQKPVMKPVEELEEKAFLHERDVPPEAGHELDSMTATASPTPYHNQPFPNVVPHSDLANEPRRDEEDQDDLTA
ncbi:MAG: hypothetical protein H0T73_19940 [Ardenticatenales bacterium]|nr:hypothetical protein [Ardenticatenales bacterium]